MLSDEEVARYEHYKDKGKVLAAEGDIEGALCATQKAYKIYPCDKLKNRIAKIKLFLQDAVNSQDERNEEEENEMTLKGGLHIPQRVHKQLYQYQKEGVEWLWKLHQEGKGGVLGDDMGLGKTIQIIGLLSGLFESNMIKRVLIIMPVSLITNWCSEFLKWNPDLNVSTFHSETKSQREKNLTKVQRGTGVVITSYGMIVANVELFKTCRGGPFVWDYIILDEGHKIKNPTKTTKAIHEIPAKHRLVLTGTPIQNDLRELWALYDFCHQGTLLGSLPTFKLQYATIITRSREKNATSGERKLGNMMAESLRQLIAPYFLRRTKKEVLNQQQGNANESPGKENADPNEKPSSSKGISKLPQKNDLIVWLHLSDVQIQIYDDFVHTDGVKDLLMTKKSPLVALTVLKKICDHPRLLSKRACLQLGMNGEITQEELEEMLSDEETHAPSIDVDHDILLKESGKLSVLVDLLERLKQEGHRTLVFSQSRKMLDIINNVLLGRNWNVIRLDGTIKKLNERQDIVKRFQKTNMYPIMLLTTQVGGVGLTLTAADRVVIYDPSWNPATDAQAVDRAYRIGQTKPVVIYRLITCGTVEEKIYRRQIFKDSITRQTTSKTKEDPHRYFTNMELKELFILDDPRFSSTQRQLQDMHSKHRLLYPALEEHLAYLHSLDIFGISDHDLMFQGTFKDDSENPTPQHDDQEFIRTRVEKAKLLLQLESEHAHNENIRSGTFCKDLTNFQKPRVHDRDIGVPSLLPTEEDYPGEEDEVDVDELIESFTTLNDQNDQVEELTEQEIKDLKNISLTDPSFAKVLDMSLREAERRKSIKIEPVKDSGSFYESGGHLNDRKDRSYEDMEDEDLKRAIQLSLREEQSKTQEERDIDEALALSLQIEKESPKTRDEEERDITRALNESLSLYNRAERRNSCSFVDLTNISNIDQDFAELLNASAREKQDMYEQPAHTTSNIFKQEHLTPKRTTTLQNQDILVVDSDEDFSGSEPEMSFSKLNQTDTLGMSTTKQYLIDSAKKYPFSRSRLSVGTTRKSVDVLYETDEEFQTSGLGSSRQSAGSSAHSSFIRPTVRKLGKYRPLASDSEEDSRSSRGSDGDSSHKKSRMTPEDDPLPDLDERSVLTSSFSDGNSKLDDPLPDLEESPVMASSFSGSSLKPGDQRSEFLSSGESKEQDSTLPEEVASSNEFDISKVPSYLDLEASCDETEPNSSLIDEENESNSSALFSEEDF